MTTPLQRALEREVLKLIARHNSKCRDAAHDRRRYHRRSGEPASLPSSTTPRHWKAHRHFNPYYVRSRLPIITRALGAHLRAGSYTPTPILLADIPKPHGGTREISLLTIPDAAVSYALGTRLITRNAHLFTSYTYAYRRDRNAHHAIQHLMSAIRGCSRLFVLEFDFSKYFDSIGHEYLLHVLTQHFLVSKREEGLVRTLLLAPRARGVADYLAGRFDTPTRGIPQGSTLSLFLANVACHELDRQLENAGATFARYADDTLVVCDSYDKAGLCARAILDHGKRSGTQVNVTKSAGISLLTGQGTAEMKNKHTVEFLAHSLSADGVGLSTSSIRRIKRKLSQLIHMHLLLQPTRGSIDRARIGDGFVDWDLVTCVNEVRRYIYGRLSDAEVRSALAGTGRFNVTRSALSFFPTVDLGKAEPLKAMDGWLVDTFVRAYGKRVRLLRSLGIATRIIDRSELIAGTWYCFPAVPFEPQIPSLYRSWLYVRRCAQIFGLERFPSPVYEYM